MNLYLTSNNRTHLLNAPTSNALDSPIHLISDSLNNQSVDPKMTSNIFTNDPKSKLDFLLKMLESFHSSLPAAMPLSFFYWSI